MSRILAIFAFLFLLFCMAVMFICIQCGRKAFCSQTRFSQPTSYRHWSGVRPLEFLSTKKMVVPRTNIQVPCLEKNLYNVHIICMKILLIQLYSMWGGEGTIYCTQNHTFLASSQLLCFHALINVDGFVRIYKQKSSNRSLNLFWI